MNGINLSNENQNSVSIKKNSKGQYDWEIKLYFSENEAEALQRAYLINAHIKKHFVGVSE